MKRIVVLTTTALVLLASSCAKEEKVPAKATEPTATVSPFTPAASGQLTTLQVKFWNKTNAPLDSLAKANAEALSTKDSTAYQAAYQAYIAERNSTCKKNGLSGGYDEYQWISQNIENAINRPLLDSLQFKTL